MFYFPIGFDMRWNLPLLKIVYSTYIQETSNVNNLIRSNSVQTHSYLKPPSNDEINVNRGYYELHVSKFHTDQNENDIAAHIADNTGIPKDKFRIIKLVSSKNMHKAMNYTSFKIVTLDSMVHRAILDQGLWGEYQVRNFESETKTARNPIGQPVQYQYHRQRNYNKNHAKPYGNSLRRNIMMKNSFNNGQTRRPLRLDNDFNEEIASRETPNRRSTQDHTNSMSETPQRPDTNRVQPFTQRYEATNLQRFRENNTNFHQGSPSQMRRTRYQR